MNTVKLDLVAIDEHVSVCDFYEELEWERLVKAVKSKDNAVTFKVIMSGGIISYKVGSLPNLVLSIYDELLKVNSDGPHSFEVEGYSIFIVSIAGDTVKIFDDAFGNDSTLSIISLTKYKCALITLYSTLKRNIIGDQPIDQS